MIKIFPDVNLPPVDPKFVQPISQGRPNGTAPIPESDEFSIGEMLAGRKSFSKKDKDELKKQEKDPNYETEFSEGASKVISHVLDIM